MHRKVNLSPRVSVRRQEFIYTFLMVTLLFGRRMIRIYHAVAIVGEVRLWLVHTLAKIATKEQMEKTFALHHEICSLSRH